MFSSKSRLLASALGFSLVLCPLSMANAQESYGAPEDRPLPKKQYVLDLGVGVLAQPKYEGASSYLATPFPLIAVGRFYVPGVGQFGDEVTKKGFFFYPSFDFKGERDPFDDKDLNGTKKVNWALELGLGGGYRYDWFRGFVELRQGINGHHGQVGQIGFDVITSPMDRVELNIGPRLGFASSDYMETYFGVSAAEAAASGGSLKEHKAGAGFKSVGLTTRISYDWTDKTTLHLQGGWDRLIGDAGNSPIVKKGNVDQFSVGLGVTYQFSFDVFE